MHLPIVLSWFMMGAVGLSQARECVADGLCADDHDDVAFLQVLTIKPPVDEKSNTISTHYDDQHAKVVLKGQKKRTNVKPEKKVVDRYLARYRKVGKKHKKDGLSPAPGPLPPPPCTGCNNCYGQGWACNSICEEDFDVSDGLWKPSYCPPGCMCR
eukprot:gnl/TRDRNA2_/TRDRNA2_90636_c0_seq1.p1 gnl/TRDRNA2_/TRDRNA2_90636_c0~~gnl/TRDRNA2_/TRDRNA2_90636_c0_seq1.p1  ORF type:complete len:156 (+),score=14.73 gnl/TRDRNA2_/TRDRNA2_90636_c0_seq1:84-551(+)